MATLEIRSLSRRYPGEAIGLADASFTIREGRIAAIIGPSGCGKTTLLRLIAGLDRPDAGDVLVDGLSILGQPAHRRGVGLMFQELALFPNMTVRENIAFGLRMVGWPRAEREQRVSDLLEVVGLANLGAQRIDLLSGSEQQRVALARTLAPQPSVLLLDEPLGAIDEVLKSTLRIELRSILTALETTAIIVSHDLRDAIAVADDLVVMDSGRILQAGPIGNVLGEPASVEVAELAGYVTLAHGPVRRGRVEEAAVGAMPVPGLEEGAAARVMAHPSSLLAVPAETGLGSGVAGLVVRSRALGPTCVVDLSLAGRVVEARWEWDLVAPREGTRLAISARPGTLRVFGSSLAALPTPSVPGTAPASASPAPRTPAAPTTKTPAAPATPTASVPVPARETPAVRAPGRTALPPTVRDPDRHPQMPLH